MDEPLVIDLRDARATDPSLAGAKAANLAIAAAARLPVLPGFVVTTAATTGGVVAAARAESRAAWASLGGGAVVRSSSTVEDAGTSSMAGQFTSVRGVTDVAAFDQAVDRVVASGLAPKSGDAGRPMAVLVQREVEPVCGGVAFGLDPVTGNRHVCAIDAVSGSPERVVSGRALAAHVVLDRRGRVQSRVGPQLDDVLPIDRLRAVARLARRAADVFGAPQDIEWAVDDDGTLWLLQSRPVTAAASAADAGPIYGPGPLAETFPEPLACLEVELWIDPLREAITAALDTVGVVATRRLRTSEVVVVVDGWPAIDLDLIGAAPHRGAVLRRLSPMRGVRRLLGAWRTGRLRAALPLLASDLVDAVDRELMRVPELEALDERDLMEILESTVTDLRALHGYEVLCGMLLRGDVGPTAAGAALRALSRGRRAGMSDAAIIAADPVTLALVAPRVGGTSTLPALGVLVAEGGAVTELGPREALRLRCRWMQELGALVASELGARLEHAGLLPVSSRVREVSMTSLAAALEGMAIGLPDEPFAPGPPLPAMFRLDARRVPIDQRSSAGGIAASAGRAAGTVRHASTAPTPGRRDVLVVDALVPELAAELEHVAAIVSETGSPLSHLAILARELSVPVAVGVERARERFPEGVRVLVDGGTGAVTVVPEAAAS